jgi:hypothetical protein
VCSFKAISWVGFYSQGISHEVNLPAVTKAIFCKRIDAVTCSDARKLVTPVNPAAETGKRVN